jgi:hypothetical protein
MQLYFKKHSLARKGTRRDSWYPTLRKQREGPQDFLLRGPSHGDVCGFL